MVHVSLVGKGVSWAFEQVVGTWPGSSVVRAPLPGVWGGPRFNPWPGHFCASNSKCMGAAQLGLL